MTHEEEDILKHHFQKTESLKTLQRHDQKKQEPLLCTESLCQANLNENIEEGFCRIWRELQKFSSSYDYDLPSLIILLKP